MSQEARRASLMEKLDVFKEEKAKHKWRKDYRRFEDFSSSVLVHTLCLPIYIIVSISLSRTYSEKLGKPLEILERFKDSRQR